MTPTHRVRAAQFALRWAQFSLVFGGVLLAQRSRDADSAAAAAGCALCSTILMIPLVLFVLNIALLIWVARDAKDRGMDNAVLWMVLVLFTSVIGLVIYIASRPQGTLVRCAHCNNQRLPASARCPHCGNP
jgi:small-conductance mechanosensitive channel